MVDYITNTVELVTAKSVEDGEEYSNWLMVLAQKTTEVSKEGGFLGIGAIRVSDKEQAILDELTGLLGVSSA